MLFTIKKITVTVVFCLFLLMGKAQVDKNIQPVSESVGEYFLNPLKKIELPPFNIEQSNQLDQIDAKNGEMPKFSRSVFTNITLDNAGSWTALHNGDRIWRVQVTSKGAQALLPYFDKFYLPQGSFFHAYSPDKTQVIGGFTSVNNPIDGYYATGMIRGESVVFEYYEPKEVSGKGIISLNEVGHAYRWINSYFPKAKNQADTLGFNDSDPCEVNINCSEGTDWQNQKRSVVCIVVKNQVGQGFCSGALVNNVRQDCTPYLLSAQHCSASTLPNLFSQWLFYFNFESQGCSNPSAAGTLDDNFITGCTKKADSNDNGGDSGSDFLLLQLNNAPPLNYNVFYSGWNNSTSAPDSGVCIHHPAGDLKKISTYTSSLVSTTWLFPTSVQNTHWGVHWSATANGYGVTEIGSSGAPLFNKQGQIVGKLTGGDSFCSLPGAPDLFGQVAFDWTSNGISSNTQLKPWLDPDNTGVSFINGRDAVCALGIAESNNEILFDVFPNPSQGIFIINFQTEEEKNISLYDAKGKSVMQNITKEKSFSFDISSYPKSVYVLQVESKNGTGVKKIILND